MEYRIPKRIIQTGRHADLPLRSRAMAAGVKSLNPDFEYLFFDDLAVERFIEEEFPQYAQIFKNFRFKIQKFDFFRYLAVYRYGGFYFDLDVVLASNLSHLLDRGCVFSFEGLSFSDHLRQHHHMDWEIGNYAFGAAPGHPFLKLVIENCVRAQTDPAWVEPMMRRTPALSRAEFLVLNTTGPGLVTRTLAENKEAAELVTVLFPDNVCDLSKWNCFGDLGFHLMEGSWRANRGHLSRRLAQYLEVWRMRSLVKQSSRLGKLRHHRGNASLPGKQGGLVSILIPAYNAERWIAQTLRSALSQTWPNIEVIVVDDGSTDATLQIARQFEPSGVRVVTQKNQGAAAARNAAYALSHGDYIQWLDADDLLAEDKIAGQMEVASQSPSKRTIFSSAWGRFMYRWDQADFTPSSLWCDLSPAEWLLRKMGQNVYMQTATWLVSRELSEAAGPWDTSLLGDDDGEYFCRMLRASDGIRFVLKSRVYYRTPFYSSLGYLSPHARAKLDAHWRSMQLHIENLFHLSGHSDRAKKACLQYLQDSLINFYPERPDVIEQMQQLAKQCGGELGFPSLSWKYAWIPAIFGWPRAKYVQIRMRILRWSFQKSIDRVLYKLSPDKPVGM